MSCMSTRLQALPVPDFLQQQIKSIESALCSLDPLSNNRVNQGILKTFSVKTFNCRLATVELTVI